MATAAIMTDQINTSCNAAPAAAAQHLTLHPPSLQNYQSHHTTPLLGHFPQLLHLDVEYNMLDFTECSYVSNS